MLFLAPSILWSFFSFFAFSEIVTTALHQALEELTTGVLLVTRPEEMNVQSNRLILGLNLVLNPNEEMLKAMLKSFPNLESLAKSHKYKVGRLKFSVTPMEKLDDQIENGRGKGKVTKNMLSPWGHHLLGHHYLDMLLALHTQLSLPLSHLDLQVNCKIIHPGCPRLTCCVKAANSSLADLARLNTWPLSLTSSWGW